MSEEILFYDLTSRDKPKCWSMNPWKTRLVLNYKGLPYKIEWTEYPDIEPKFKSFGIPPNPKDVNPVVEYSIPTIRLPDGRFVMDSFKIAEELERLHPDPPLHIHEKDSTARAKAAVGAAFRPMFAVFTLRVPEMILNPGFEDWWFQTREKIVGMPSSEFKKYDIDTVWPQVEAGLGQVRELLTENGEGPYVLGEKVGFADFVIAAMWVCLERLDREGDLFGRVMKFDPEVFKAHYDACRKWTERDDH